MINTKSLFEVSEIQIGYYPKIKPCNRPQITTSKKTFDYIKSYVKEEEINYREMFFVIYLDRANGAIGINEIGKGGMSTVIADPKLIFETALLSHASYLILAHNHPSGDLNPSTADGILTKKIKTVGDLLTLPILDHLIFNNDDYYSFTDENNIL